MFGRSRLGAAVQAMDKVEDHPLAETAGVESDEEVVEERSTRSRSRARDRHAEESDGETPSDRDEGLVKVP